MRGGGGGEEEEEEEEAISKVRALVFFYTGLCILSSASANVCLPSGELLSCSKETYKV